MYAEAIIHCGDERRAGALVERLAPWGRLLSTSTASVEGLVDHYVGGLYALLGRDEEAEAALARAVSFNERVGARFFGARTDLQWGQLLAQRRDPGDLERARELLTRAHALGQAHGYGALERRAADTLAELDR